MHITVYVTHYQAAILHKLAHCEAKLDVGFHLTGMQSVTLSVRWVCELEKAEFTGSFCKGGMEVQHMVPA